jgi:CYTH domain-containing protein
MGKEIERKFLVQGTVWRELSEGIPYRQGYLSSVKERTVRVRTIQDRGFLTVKGVTQGISRLEYEYAIPLEDANALLAICEKPLIEKNRYKIPFDGLIWEVDEFFGDNDGLIIAEVELVSADQSFSKPSWVGEEVSADPRYYNSNLIKNPFKNWAGA